MEKILILDFGGQYNQLIARRVREQHVYCELHPHTMPIEEIRRFDPIGIIFTGGPHSVYLDDSPRPDPGVFELGVPILGPKRFLIRPARCSGICLSGALPG